MKQRLTTFLVEFSNLKLTRPASDKIRFIEIIAVALTAIGKFIFVDCLNLRLPFVIVTILAWSIYVVYRYKKDKMVLKDWGFRTDNFKSAIKLIVPFVIVSILSFFIIGYSRGTLNMTWHILPLLITYPIWGSVQQFLTIALVAGNLNNLKSMKLKKISIIFITAILFSVVHYPSVWLMIGTFILALFYGYVYLKVKNIYALGLFHGWLGALFYYTVVNQDPFADVFLKFL
ncbi:CPBP family intramembrane glutamic endopeptidase [uncultured Winogradskyella sp.]|uniref:CPBP family intramembrane glutamic endopeptidase n=1 Tax=uncultured Winogradskyella sp. TaxID=395353 RepID=UPI002616C5FB|nr:CPBP family intramembrane glutamic endopeptidase [uncultured Winogradskyella sp.]